ncbi:MAG TPA: hypothetical protein DIT10_04585 [Chryseobacterium sp.]|nr:hypothetical protein [Chryseobacterium sp.]
MGIGFVILIHLIILFMMSLICSLIAGVIAYFTSNKEGRRRKIVLAGIAPFVGLYTFYICVIIGASMVTDKKKVDIGIGDAWYVPLENNRQLLFIDLPEQAYIAKEDGQTFISEVSEIEENGSQIIGKTFENQYFSYDTKTDEVKKFSTEKELVTSIGNKTLKLVNAYDFYSDRKSKIMGLWPFWIGIVCLMISLGAIYIWKLIIFAVFKK